MVRTKEVVFQRVPLRKGVCPRFQSHRAPGNVPAVSGVDGLSVPLYPAIRLRGLCPAPGGRTAPPGIPASPPAAGRDGPPAALAANQPGCPGKTARFHRIGRFLRRLLSPAEGGTSPPSAPSGRRRRGPATGPASGSSSRPSQLPFGQFQDSLGQSAFGAGDLASSMPFSPMLQPYR